MNVDEEDLHKLGESLDANLSVLQVVVTYDMNLEPRDYSLTIENLYDECQKDYSLGKKLLDQQENENEEHESSTSREALILEEDNTVWMRLEYDKLGKDLRSSVDNHQEKLEASDTKTGREKLEDAMTNYEVLAWSIPPSYNLSLEYVDVPPKERDQSEIIKDGRIVE
jgi:hypothetical protein